MRTDPRLLVLVLSCGLGASSVAADSWSVRKCALYRDAWQQVLDTQPPEGTSDGFMARHQDFVDNGCPAATRICARTDGDVTLANLMTILSMNEGMASTFVPFGCPDRD
ncbi:hypothetical protein [Sedimentitalea nanhaiensis]|uniref:Rap1a immunity protein domain-containing protein n=1 Tax=Sedimentitalea nanhaiensis TaxID=999627 RepID=A0A1I6X8V0_9RHOB|nr:hypothetical protein [Sedimentitalea nanhaiensis]SFT34224.1 hypothetical protein SAMN05216236_101115 [Sedimentitalea nanhaiensis]